MKSFLITIVVLILTLMLVSCSESSKNTRPNFSIVYNVKKGIVEKSSCSKNYCDYVLKNGLIKVVEDDNVNNLSIKDANFKENFISNFKKSFNVSEITEYINGSLNEKDLIKISGNGTLANNKKTNFEVYIIDNLEKIITFYMFSNIDKDGNYKDYSNDFKEVITSIIFN